MESSNESGNSMMKIKIGPSRDVQYNRRGRFDIAISNNGWMWTVQSFKPSQLIMLHRVLTKFLKKRGLI